MLSVWAKNKRLRPGTHKSIMSSFSHVSSFQLVDSQHEDMVHDSQFDYYATKLATCSSDRTIKIFDVVGEHHHCCATLTGHEGPVWQVAWAHPQNGVLLASCSYDGSVIVHKEVSQNNWVRVFEHRVHESSVNSIAWAPHEFGLILACASSDGNVSILEYLESGQNWKVTHFKADALGCNSVSWAPFSALGGESAPVKRLATGSCDNLVRIWKCVSNNPGQEDWQQEEKVGVASPHTDWVRDVAWAPNTAMPYNIIASCSEDRTVFIWKQTKKDEPWSSSLLATFDAPVWRVSWSVTGNVLAVSTGDHKVSLWKQAVDESWIQISSVDSI